LLKYAEIVPKFWRQHPAGKRRIIEANDRGKNMKHKKRRKAFMARKRSQKKATEQAINEYYYLFIYLFIYFNLVLINCRDSFIFVPKK